VLAKKDVKIANAFLLLKFAEKNYNLHGAKAMV
jgi:hypothetical protein